MADLMRMTGKAFQYLGQKGLRETVRRTALHFGRKRAERRFVQGMRLPEEELARQRGTEFSRPLLFSVVVPLYNTPMDLLRETIASVQGQTYGQWELCLADGSDDAHGEVGQYCRERAAEDARIHYRKLEKNGGISENTNACLEMAAGEYIALFDHDDLLMPNALFEARSAIEKTGADFLYSDEMIFQSPNREKVIGIRLKPGFAPDSLLTNNYICHMTVFSRELLEKVGGFRKEFDGSQDHDLILRLTNRAKGIAHISKVLYLWRSIPSSVASDINSKRYAIEAGRSAVEHFLRAEKGEDAQVESTEVFPTMYRVRYPIHGTPTVRVILDARKDTGDIAERVNALRRSAGWDACGWTVLGRKPENEAERNDFAALRTGIGLADEKTENYSGRRISWISAGNDSRERLLSLAVSQSAEDYLLFADGIPEAMEDGWLREMLSHAQHAHVGAVGAKLHFRRGDVRHAGVVIGMGPEGIAGRPYYMGDADSEGYFGQMAVVENVSAVTDCWMVSREKFLAAGGFSAEYQDALFDVDLCLRLLEMGYYNVFTPHARLKMGRAKDAHFDVGKEHASYSLDQEVFRKRNAGFLERGDPYFHPALSLKYEDWRIQA